jgi:hypothetical protein
VDLGFLAALVILSKDPDFFRSGDMKNTEKDIKCPKCTSPMTFQGVKSVGVGASRIFNVDVYLCSRCGCKGRYDEKAQKIIEIQD